VIAHLRRMTVPPPLPAEPLTVAATIAAAHAAGLAEPAAIVRDLDGDLVVAIGGERPLSPASMIKTAIAVALEVRYAAGELRPDDGVVVEAANMTANDAASPLVPGYASTYDELARLMTTRSDNVATNQLIALLDRARITRELHALGCRETFVRRKLSGGDPLIADPGAVGRNAHPIGDAAHLFARIARGTVPGAERLLAMLDAQAWNDKLSPGLAPGDRFAHKTGDTSEVSHDGGVLRTAGGTRYVLVVYTALPSSPASDARLAAFMRLVRPSL